MRTLAIFFLSLGLGCLGADFLDPRRGGSHWEDFDLFDSGAWATTANNNANNSAAIRQYANRPGIFTMQSTTSNGGSTNEIRKVASMYYSAGDVHRMTFGARIVGPLVALTNVYVLAGMIDGYYGANGAYVRANFDPSDSTWRWMFNTAHGGNIETNAWRSAAITTNDWVSGYIVVTGTNSAVLHWGTNWASMVPVATNTARMNNTANKSVICLDIWTGPSTNVGRVEVDWDYVGYDATLPR